MAAEKDESDPSPQSSRKLKPALPGALLPFTSFSQSQPLSDGVHLSGSLPLTIIYPLSQSIRKLLGVTAKSTSSLATAIVGHAVSGTPIWQCFNRSVIRIAEDVVVKVAQRLDHDEHGILQFVEGRFHSIPAPRALWLVTIGSTSFLFMTLVAGTSLESRWPSLSLEAKTQIQHVLDQQLLTLRKLELPPGVPLGSPIGKCVCKDVRRDERVSSSPIYSEAEFNDFLLHSPSSRASPNHKNWDRSVLRDDHRILFTHGDFHPRNIMVVDGEDGHVKLSGIIDWETSGFYPEYWEVMKAMNTRSCKDTNDWWEYLPSSILGYDQEIVLDRFLENSIVY